MDPRGAPLDIVVNGLMQGLRFIWAGLFTPTGIAIVAVFAVSIWISLRFGSED